MAFKINFHYLRAQTLTQQITQDFAKTFLIFNLIKLKQILHLHVMLIKMELEEELFGGRNFEGRKEETESEIEREMENRSNWYASW